MTHYAAASQWQSGSPLTALLDELSRTMEHFYPRFDDPWCSDEFDSFFKLMRESFLGFAIQNDLGLYVQEKLNTDPYVNVNIGTLLGAFEPSPRSHNRKYQRETCTDKELIHSVARHYLNKNTVSEVRGSKWSTSVSRAQLAWASSTNDKRVGLLLMLSVLVEAGADPGQDEDALAWVDFVLIAPEEWHFKHRSMYDSMVSGRDELLENMLAQFVELAFTHSTRLRHNQIYKGSTLWSLFMKALHNYSRQGHKKTYIDENTIILRIVKVFLRDGASLQDTGWAAKRNAPKAKEVIAGFIESDFEMMEELVEEERLDQKKPSILSLQWWGWNP